MPRFVLNQIIQFISSSTLILILILPLFLFLSLYSCVPCYRLFPSAVFPMESLECVVHIVIVIIIILRFALYFFGSLSKVSFLFNCEYLLFIQLRWLLSLSYTTFIPHTLGLGTLIHGNTEHIYTTSKLQTVEICIIYMMNALSLFRLTLYFLFSQTLNETHTQTQFHIESHSLIRKKILDKTKTERNNAIVRAYEQPMVSGLTSVCVCVCARTHSIWFNLISILCMKKRGNSERLWPDTTIIHLGEKENHLFTDSIHWPFVGNQQENEKKSRVYLQWQQQKYTLIQSTRGNRTASERK